MTTNVDLVRTYLAAIQRFDVEAASALIDDAIVQTELPNRLYAKGQVRTKAEMMRDLPKGRAVLREQSYPIETIFGAGDLVTVETKWTGTLNVPLGRLQPGDAIVAHICMVFTIKDGRIVAQRNYDCYEDFT
jgi:ketosteroid isomerase-like protein